MINKYEKFQKWSLNIQNNTLFLQIVIENLKTVDTLRKKCSFGDAFLEQKGHLFTTTRTRVRQEEGYLIVHTTTQDKVCLQEVLLQCGIYLLARISKWTKNTKRIYRGN